MATIGVLLGVLLGGLVGGLAAYYGLRQKKEPLPPWERPFKRLEDDFAALEEKVERHLGRASRLKQLAEGEIKAKASAEPTFANGDEVLASYYERLRRSTT